VTGFFGGEAVLSISPNEGNEFDLAISRCTVGLRSHIGEFRQNPSRWSDFVNFDPEF
jgi:hypothetical protein